MKIAFFCTEFPPKLGGGIGIFIKTISTALANNGHEVKVVEFGPEERTRDENGIQIITLQQSELKKIGWLINRYTLWRWITNAARQKEIDILELPEYQGWLPFPVMDRRAKVVVRLHQSATAMHKLSGAPFSVRDTISEYLTLFFHRRWIGVTQHIINLTKQIFHLRPVVESVIFNPVTIDKATIAALPETPPINEPYVLFVGSMTERKGVLTLAKAAKLIIAENQVVHFVFIGSETNYRGRPISQEVIEIIGGENKERIIFLGHLHHDKVMWWMRHAFVVASPSQIESFGLVPIEAMALGVPAIYTKFGPGSEIVEHGKDGILVDPNDPRELAERLLNLVLHPEYSLFLAENGRESVIKKFSLEECLRKTINFYHGTLEENCVISGQQLGD